MLMTTSYIIVDRTEFDQCFKYTLISLDEFNKHPYKTALGPKKTRDGFLAPDLGWIVSNKWQEGDKEAIQYFDHKYEIACVLGEDKENKSLLVYGNKIGEKIVNTGNNVFHNYTFHQRGDLLLLKQLEKSSKFSIIHNINQARLKAQMDEFGFNTK